MLTLVTAIDHILLYFANIAWTALLVTWGLMNKFSPNLAVIPPGSNSSTYSPASFAFVLCGTREVGPRRLNTSNTQK